MIKMDDIISLSKRKGFVFQSSEIYTGLNGAWDYGPLGVELLKNLKELWWQNMTWRDNVVGIDSAILMHPKVWDASGHTKQFSDPMIDNKTTKKRFRADVLIEEHIEKLHRKGKIAESEELQLKLDRIEKNEEFYNLIKEYEIKDEGSDDWTEVKNFNLMFRSYLGATDDSSSVVYLRPETAQGIFVNFKNVMESARQKVPFGIAQIGKAFRNEINTKNFLFRTREFEQMEMQYFVKPGEHLAEFDKWQQERWDFWKSLGMDDDNLRLKVHEKLAHYADKAVDIEFNFPFGWGEIEGIHSRTNFDLNAHQEESGKKLEYVDTVNKDRFVPYVVETSAGASRGFMAVLCNAYDEEEITNDKGKTETRKVMRFTPQLAPVKAAIFPLVKKDGMPEFAQNIQKDLQNSFNIEYDVSGAIGRRYRRQDEVGTPFCITVDGQSLEDNTVTVRERDSMNQERISSDNLKLYLLEKLSS